jgi:hypothetical protein
VSKGAWQKGVAIDLRLIGRSGPELSELFVKLGTGMVRGQESSYAVRLRRQRPRLRVK